MKVTTFQAEVLFGTIKREMDQVRNDRNTPQSLRMLAIEQLQSVHDQLRVIVEQSTGDD